VDLGFVAGVLGAYLQISIPIGQGIATGRAIAAARVLLGLDQGALASSANVSVTTISNAERGHGVRDETLHAILAAVRRRGATVTIDRSGFASIAINFHEPPTMQEAPRLSPFKRLNFEARTLLRYATGARR
jgi:transcriptional regulator with XRE-family HTH domain